VINFKLIYLTKKFLIDNKLRVVTKRLFHAGGQSSGNWIGQGISRHENKRSYVTNHRKIRYKQYKYYK